MVVVCMPDPITKYVFTYVDLLSPARANIHNRFTRFTQDTARSHKVFIARSPFSISYKRTNSQTQTDS
jgi:hypothetical protein